MLTYIENFYLKKKFDIKKYYLIEKLTKIFLYAIQSPIYFFILPILLVIYALRPFILIRWSDLKETRLGNMAAINELYLCEKISGINMPKQKYFDIFYFNKKPCNKQLAIMFKRKLNVFPTFFVRKMSNLNKFLRFAFSLNNEIHEIKVSCSARDVHLLWEKIPPNLSFTPEEKIKGKNILNKFGLKNNEKFVCLFARDSRYLEKYHIPSASKGNWDYQRFRNFNIDNFIAAADEITRRGYYVFRVGKIAEKKLNSSNPKIIDYAFSTLKSDFMDIYLAANCSFFLSSGCGIDELPSIFRRPLASVMIPIGYTQTNRTSIISILKHHFDKKTKKKLSLTEIFSKGLSMASTGEEYLRQNIELVDNSSDEIKDLAIEMLDMIEGKNFFYNKDAENQKIFWDLYRKNLTEYENNFNHGKELRGKIGAKFLNENSNYLI